MSTARISRATAFAVLALALGCCACTRTAEPSDGASQPAREAAALEPRARRYEPSSASQVEIELGSGERRAHGQLELARGRLWVDAAALDRTRADLTFDMTTLRLNGGSPPTSGRDPRTLTEQSLDWLEVRSASALGGHPEQRYAHVSVLRARAADGNDARAGQHVAATTPGATARRARMAVSGELELHGVRLPLSASVLATFEWAEPALDGPPRHIELSTAEPVAVDWLGHDIVPRDERGDVSSVTLAEMRRQPAQPARVSLRWTAELAHTGSAPPP